MQRDRGPVELPHGLLNAVAALRLHYSSRPSCSRTTRSILRGDALVVGRDQRRAALAADQVEELGEDDVGGMLVEVAGRLVGEHQRRLVGERAGDRDALLLAARQLRRAMVEPLRQGRACRAAAPRVRCAACGSAPRTSCGRTTFSTRVELGQQVVELVDEAEQLAAQPRAAVVVELGGFLAAAAGSSPRTRLRAARPPAAASTCPSPTGRAARRSRRAATARSTPRSTSMVTSPWVKLRLRPRVTRTGSLIAQHLHRIGARRLVGRDRASRGTTGSARSGRSP